MSRAKQFIELQDKANQELDQLGQVSIRTAIELELLGDSLTADEIHEVCQLADKKAEESFEM